MAKYHFIFRMPFNIFPKWHISVASVNAWYAELNVSAIFNIADSRVNKAIDSINLSVTLVTISQHARVTKVIALVYPCNLAFDVEHNLNWSYPRNFQEKCSFYWLSSNETLLYIYITLPIVMIIVTYFICRHIILIMISIYYVRESCHSSFEEIDELRCACVFFLVVKWQKLEPIWQNKLHLIHLPSVNTKHQLH